MTQAAQELLTRMTLYYGPPEHLRADAALRQQVLDGYAALLEPFDPITLDKAWARILTEHTSAIWPSPGQLIAACRHCAPPSAVASDEHQRRRRAITLTDAYVRHYRRTSHLARLASTEGWAAQLLTYVREAAWVQAQILSGCTRLGWDPHILLANVGAFDSSQEAFAAYRQSIAGPLQRGQIRVSVPPSRICVWKEQGLQEAEHQPVTEPTDVPSSQSEAAAVTQPTSDRPVLPPLLPPAPTR